MKRYFKDGDTVLFQGDSVTDWYRERDTECKTIENMGQGYPRLFKLIYDTLFPGNKVNFVNRGVSGDRIKNLLERYDEDFKSLNPDFISVMIGINDTWHGIWDNTNTTVEQFKKSYRELLEKIKKDMPNAKIMILEQFAFTDHPDRLGWDKDLDKKRAVTRELAAEFADYFIPIYDIMNEAKKENFTMRELSEDGVHPVSIGHSLIAVEIMKKLEII